TTATGSAPTTVTPAAAASLVFTRDPSETTATATAFVRQPTVTLLDAYGNVASGDAASTVTLALSKAGSATLSCTPSTSKATSGGVAAFSGCAVDKKGTYTLTAARAGLTSATSAGFTIVKRPQTITFTSTAPTTATAGGPAYVVTATASSGQPVSFSLASASTGCVLSGSTVSFTAVGTCIVQADQPGNDDLEPAPTVTQSFAVARGVQRITFTSTAPANAAVGGSSIAAATASSSLPVTLSVPAASASFCRIDANGTVTFVAVGTCTLNANQAGDASFSAADLVQQSFSVGAGLKITATAGAGGGRYTFSGTGSTLLGTVTINVCSANIIPCPTGKFIDTASRVTTTGATFNTAIPVVGTPTGVLASGTYYAQATASATSFSPPFAFTVP
ncbi:MAG: Endoglucanase-like protein, partial [Solirubrobacterales bacterium]|nr:Endoglucanase-like protein [Solirubrobacterales bacterium]